MDLSKKIRETKNRLSLLIEERSKLQESSCGIDEDTLSLIQQIKLKEKKRNDRLDQLDTEISTLKHLLKEKEATASRSESEFSQEKEELISLIDQKKERISELKSLISERQAILALKDDADLEEQTKENTIKEVEDQKEEKEATASRSESEFSQEKEELISLIDQKKERISELKSLISERQAILALKDDADLEEQTKENTIKEVEDQKEGLLRFKKESEAKARGEVARLNHQLDEAHTKLEQTNEAISSMETIFHILDTLRPGGVDKKQPLEDLIAFYYRQKQSIVARNDTLGAIKQFIEQEQRPAIGPGPLERTVITPKLISLVLEGVTKRVGELEESLAKIDERADPKAFSTINNTLERVSAIVPLLESWPSSRSPPTLHDELKHLNSDKIKFGNGFERRLKADVAVALQSLAKNIQNENEEERRHKRGVPVSSQSHIVDDANDSSLSHLRDQYLDSENDSLRACVERVEHLTGVSLGLIIEYHRIDKYGESMDKGGMSSSSGTVSSPSVSSLESGIVVDGTDPMKIIKLYKHLCNTRELVLRGVQGEVEEVQERLGVAEDELSQLQTKIKENLDKMNTWLSEARKRFARYKALKVAVVLEREREEKEEKRRQMRIEKEESKKRIQEQKDQRRMRNRMLLSGTIAEGEHHPEEEEEEEEEEESSRSGSSDSSSDSTPHTTHVTYRDVSIPIVCSKHGVIVEGLNLSSSAVSLDSDELFELEKEVIKHTHELSALNKQASNTSSINTRLSDHLKMRIKRLEKNRDHIIGIWKGRGNTDRVIRGVVGRLEECKKTASTPQIQRPLSHGANEHLNQFVEAGLLTPTIPSKAGVDTTSLEHHDDATGTSSTLSADAQDYATPARRAHPLAQSQMESPSTPGAQSNLSSLKGLVDERDAKIEELDKQIEETENDIRVLEDTNMRLMSEQRIAEEKMKQEYQQETADSYDAMQKRKEELEHVREILSDQIQKVKQETSSLSISTSSSTISLGGFSKPSFASLEDRVKLWETEMGRRRELRDTYREKLDADRAANDEQLSLLQETLADKQKQHDDRWTERMENKKAVKQQLSEERIKLNKERILLSAVTLVQCESYTDIDEESFTLFPELHQEVQKKKEHRAMLRSSKKKRMQRMQELREADQRSLYGSQSEEPPHPYIAHKHIAPETRLSSPGSRSTLSRSSAISMSRPSIGRTSSLPDVSGRRRDDVEGGIMETDELDEQHGLSTGVNAEDIDPELLVGVKSTEFVNWLVSQLGITGGRHDKSGLDGSVSDQMYDVEIFDDQDRPMEPRSSEMKSSDLVMTPPTKREEGASISERTCAEVNKGKGVLYHMRKNDDQSATAVALCRRGAVMGVAAPQKSREEPFSVRILGATPEEDSSLIVKGYVYAELSLNADMSRVMFKFTDSANPSADPSIRSTRFYQPSQSGFPSIIPSDIATPEAMKHSLNRIQQHQVKRVWKLFFNVGDIVSVGYQRERIQSASYYVITVTLAHKKAVGESIRFVSADEYATIIWVSVLQYLRIEGKGSIRLKGKIRKLLLSM
ncbi:Centrosomal protein of 131kDa like protein [Aduncisulcus paluster]|uniref:Centrosomal protein of 131kDa like protein n=1 Tax=Aduncisulcus paluster TaxID=2918883 RepID=A0ABQ5KSK4_9EUKA|nr:Centrosomal protein of 131kDa like protein [Aduncisulcus paluster]